MHFLTRPEPEAAKGQAKRKNHTKDTTSLILFMNMNAFIISYLLTSSFLRNTIQVLVDPGAGINIQLATPLIATLATTLPLPTLLL